MAGLEARQVTTMPRIQRLREHLLSVQPALCVNGFVVCRLRWTGGIPPLCSRALSQHDTSHVQVSAKEEKDLQTLLEMFALGVGDVEEFQERLQAELAALEVTSCTELPLACSNMWKMGHKLSSGTIAPSHLSRDAVG